MLFNSLQFAVFFAVFLLSYYILPIKQKSKWQNISICAGSYIFYGLVEMHFLWYLVFASLFSFFLARGIETYRKYGRLLMLLGVLQGIGSLLYFKYYSFFIDGFNSLFSEAGFQNQLQTLNIIMPLGISFFSFRLISYLIDVYNEKTDASKDLLVFCGYVAFFPSILSGPIDKARDLVPQFSLERKFNYNSFSNGMRQFAWGLFKKVVVADNCMLIANILLNKDASGAGSDIFLGGVFYVFQLYADFSGYSDMAIGIGSMLGLKITKNFGYPLFAQNIADFWRRWHISLTSWLTEYVFTPLALNFRGMGNSGMILAIVINFIIVGLWHGPSYTYVVFGFIHGCLYIPLIVSGKFYKPVKLSTDRALPSLREIGRMALSFLITLFTFIIFRSESIGEAFSQIGGIFDLSLFSMPNIAEIDNVGFTAGFIAIMLIMEWRSRAFDFALERSVISSIAVRRWSLYYFVVLSIICFGAFTQSQFIYFQF